MPLFYAIRESKNAAFNLLSNVSANNTGCKSYVEIAQVTERLKEYRVATNEGQLVNKVPLMIPQVGLRPTGGLNLLPLPPSCNVNSLFF